MADHPHISIQPPPAISKRERQLIELASRGQSDVEIADELCISKATVSSYWARLRSKLGAKSRTEAVATVLRGQAEAEHRKFELQFEPREDEPCSLSAFHSFQALVEGATDGIFVADSDNRFSYVNGALARLFGYAEADLIGESVELLVPERFRSDHRKLSLEFVGHPENRRMGHDLYVPGLRKDRTELAVCITLSRFPGHSDLGTVGIVRDYTAESQALEARGDRLRKVADRAS